MNGRSFIIVDVQVAVQKHHIVFDKVTVPILLIDCFNLPLIAHFNRYLESIYHLDVPLQKGKSIFAGIFILFFEIHVVFAVNLQNRFVLKFIGTLLFPHE